MLDFTLGEAAFRFVGTTLDFADFCFGASCWTLGPWVDSLATGALLAQEGGAGGRGFLGETSFIWVMLAIGVLFYFLMMRPEQKQKARIADMQQGLKKNDKVVTIGGIYGTVVNAAKGSEEITLRIDDNTRMRVERNSVKRVISDEKKPPDEGKKESD